MSSSVMKTTIFALLGLMSCANLVQSTDTARPLIWRYLNNDSVKPISPITANVSIRTPPDTDIWRPAVNKDNFTAPFLYTTIPTAQFQSVRVTVTAPWKTLYDQGGLVITFPSNRGQLKWIKAGIEFADDLTPDLGVVATDRLSDWSLSPIREAYTGQAKATIVIERQGTDAWVYVIEKTGRRALRQVTWAFNTGVPQNIQVGIYAAKPTEESGPGHARDTLTVSFENFELETVGGKYLS